MPQIYPLKNYFFAVVLQYHIPANLASVMPSMCLFQFLLDFFKVELNVGGFIYLFIIIIIIILMFFRSQNFFWGALVDKITLAKLEPLII